MSTAGILARNLIEQWELTPPPLGFSEGDFGGSHPRYAYAVEYDPALLEYDDVPRVEEGRLAYFRRVSVDVFYRAKRAKDKPKRLLHVESALTSSERFEQQAREANEKDEEENWFER